MAFGEDLVGVTALGGIHGVQPKIVDHQEVDRDQLAELGLVAAVEAGVLEGLEHLVGTQREHRGAAAAGDVTEGVGEEGLADPDRADDRDMGVGVEEAERDQLVPERLVVADLGGGIPGFELEGRVEPGALSAGEGGLALAARDFVTQH